MNAVTKQTTVTPEMMEEFLRLKKENDELRAANIRAMSGSTGGIKVSAKGAVSFYGVGRFPITLYKEQWEKVFEKVDSLKQFIVLADKYLASKGGESKLYTETEVANINAELAKSIGGGK